ncbi:protein BIG GRAIN 1-like B [Chenopodium quinoa]|uniref:protein BIG GRAIN 1-like B n=1 Tax=Chenopodium quinoa TaxID=63459 RepID=UPI000B774AC8|nr:protein BIG GRAIN 1-like B [Chenopodium quinoa]
MSKFETITIPFHNTTHKRRAKNPSFSSILLDAIYRSIDEDDDLHHYPRTTPTSPTRSIITKQSDCNTIQLSSSSKQRRTKMRSDSTLETVDLRRAIMIESWMERQPPQQPPQQPPYRKHFHLGDVLDQKIRIVRQKSVPSLPRASDNSSTTDFSSSSSSCFTNLTPRSTTSRDQSSSRIFTKTKSRALKIYGDLKRSKQQNTAPISPGRRIAAFLNSIFRNSGGSPARNSPEIKSPPPTTTAMTAAMETATDSTCSSASSFSRSCLSNKTTSSTKSSKRSVRFYPVSVIVDEDSRPCGHKSLQKNEVQEPKKLASPPNEHAFGGESDEKERRRRREKEIDALMMMIKTNCGNIQQRHVSNLKDGFVDDDEMEEDDDEDDDGGGSCASSDLFELENLSSIGVSRYYEELPVYGTTSLKNITA